MQIETLATYCIFLLVVLLLPYATRSFTKAFEHRLIDRGIAAVILLAALALTTFRGGHVQAIWLAVFLPLIGSRPMLLVGGVAATMLFATSIWWDPHWQQSSLQTLCFIMLGLAAGLMPRLLDGDIGAAASPKPFPMRSILTLFFFVGIGTCLVTRPYDWGVTMRTLWHHWGAYISPADAWLAGGRPFTDFPVQYGLGPTALIAASCGANCWTGMFTIVVIANGLYVASVAGCAALLAAPLGKGTRLLVMLSTLFVCVLWLGFPAKYGSILMTPSVSGLRFLSITALLLHILIAEKTGKRRDWIGHAIWLADFFWSPEAAAFASLTWWPYLALRNAASAANMRAAMVSVMRTVALAGAGLVMATGALLALVRLIAGEWPTAKAFLTYIFYPPGPLPVDMFGPIWMAVAIVLIAGRMLAMDRNTEGLRPLYVCLLATFAAGTYYLSRSHDNNILNLLPFLLLVITATLARIAARPDAETEFAKGFLTATLTAVVAFVPAFNYTGWQWHEPRTPPTFVGSANLMAQIAMTSATPPTIVPRDAITAVNYARSRSDRTVLLFDERYVMPGAVPGRTWTSVNSDANFSPLPQSLVEHYVQQGARRYRRDGWMVVQEPKWYRWVIIFQKSYTIRERRRFGAYSAYHMVPRLP